MSERCVRVGGGSADIWVFDSIFLVLFEKCSYFSSQGFLRYR